MSKYKQVNEEIQLLQTPIQSISGPNFHTALSIAIGLVCEVINWDYGEIWTKSKYGSILELSPSRYINPHRGSAYILALEQFRLCSEAFILSPGIGTVERFLALAPAF